MDPRVPRPPMGATPRRLQRFTALLACLALALGLLTTAATTGPAGASTAPRSGSFSVLTYNVAGLPLGLSSANPEANTPAMGQRISAYDIVNVQEDFNYHAALYAANSHPHRTATSGGVPFGDGLNTLSNFPFEDFQRVKWSSCNGTDCLTPKGWSLARVRLAEGVFVDVYNLHPNAGSTSADLSARRSNITQLSNAIATISTGNAVIVMGDTNTRYTRSGDNIRELMTHNGLTDAWVQSTRGGAPPAIGSPALVCDDANVTDSCEVVDKILYRGNRLIDLQLSHYANDNALFRTADDQMLSDHYPIAARFSWTLADGYAMSDRFGGPHGNAFTHIDQVSPTDAVRSVQLRSGNRIDQVGLTLANGTELRAGGNGGTLRSLTLAPGEYLSQLTVSQGQVSGRTRIFSAHFLTNQGRSVSGGTVRAEQMTFVAPPGYQIAGFHGRSGSEVDKLGVIYIPTAAPPTQYVNLVARHSQMVADVAGGSFADGARIIQWWANGGQNQQWQLVDVGGGFSQVVNRATGKCLDVFNAATTNGAQVVQWTCGTGTNQHWRTESVGSGHVRVVARHSGRCLDVPGASTAGDVQLIQWSCGSGTNQHWRLAPV